MKKEGKTHTRNAGITKTNNLISNWLEEHGDPSIEYSVKLNLAIANKISNILAQKNLKPADLAKLMGKQRSEISRWLSGMHTFSTKTIARISTVLNEDIVYIEPTTNNVYWTVFVSTEGQTISEDDFEDSDIDDSTLALAQ